MKVYVDSRYRISGTNEDFVWQMPESVDMAESLAYVDVVLVPNTIRSLGPGNDKIRFLESVVTQQGGSATIYACEATIAPGQYNGFSLATALQTAMRAVSNITPATAITVTYDAILAKLKLTTTALYGTQIDVYPDGLLAAWNSAQGVHTVDLKNTQSAGKVCGFLGESTIAFSASLDASGDSVIDVQRHHCCYIHSDLGTPGMSYGPQGQSDIIRRVVLDSIQNGLTIDRHTTPHDNVEVNAKSLRNMSFRLAGSDGETLDLRGHHWSFSVVFHPKI